MVWLRIRRWVVRPVFWLLALVAVAIFLMSAVLRSETFKGFVAERLQREVGRVVGRPVAIGGVDFSLLPMSLTVRDLLIPGASAGDPPFLEARELVVDVDADALRKEIVDLQTITVRGLRVRVALGPDGRDNLPPFPRSKDGPGRFTIRIGGLYVEDSELELADRRVPLDVAAHAVLVRLVGLGGTRLQGSVTAQEVETTLPGATPWPATVSGRIRIESDRVDILESRVASAYVRARANGSIGWKGGTHGEIHARGAVDGRWLDERGWLRGDVAGEFDVDGSVRFARRDLRIEGRLTSPAATLFGFDLAALEAHVAGDADRLDATIDQADYRGAALTGTFGVELAGKAERARLELRGERLPVRALLADLDLPDFRLAAVADGTFTLDFPLRRVRDGVGSAELTLAGVDPRIDAGVPADGLVSVRLGDGAVTIPELTLETAAERIEATGSYGFASRRGAFDVRATSHDLGELARLQPFVAPEPPPIWLPTAGRGVLTAAVTLGPEGASADVTMDLDAVATPALVAEHVAGALSVAPDRVHGLDLEISRDRARLHVAGTLPFETEGARAAVPTDLAVELEGWPVEEGERFSGIDLPVAGPAFGALRLNGPASDLTGELVGYVAPVSVAGIAAERLDVELGWDADRLDVRRAELAAPAGAATGSGTLRFADKALDFTLATAGAGVDLSAAPFADLWGDGIAGRLALEGKVSGTVEAPVARIGGTVDSLRLLGREVSVASAAAGDGAKAESSQASQASEAPKPTSGRVAVALAGGRLDVDFSLPRLVELHGGGPFSPGESAALDLALASDVLGRWIEVAVGEPVAGLDGELRARLAVRQEAAGPLTAELSAERLDLALDGRELALLEPARLRYDGARLALDTLYLGERDGPGEVFVGGSVDPAAGGKLDLHVQAEAPVDWVEGFVGLDLDGEIQLLTRVGGTVAKPELNGEAALTGARMIPPRIPHTLDRLEALALFYPDAVVLDSATGEFAGGSVRAFGRIDLPREARPVDYRFQMRLENASVRYPAGFLLRGGGELTLQAAPEGRQLRGEIDLDRLDYVQDLDLSPIQIVQRFLTRTRLQVEETDDFLASTYLNVAVEAPGALRVRNNLARIDGGVDLAVRGTLANPVLFGEVTTERGGTIEYASATYTLERATLTFADPSRIVPIVDILASTKIDDYEVSLSVGGSLDRLTTSFASNPPLSEYDVLALLATGSATGDSTFSGSGGVGTREESALAAESLLYGQAANLIGQRFGNLFGIDRLRIDPLTTGDSVSAARVSVGKRLSRRVYVTYSVDPSSTAQQILEVEWKLSDELTLVLTQNGDGSYALDTRWGRRF